MSGGWQTFRCDRCPLVFELGGYAASDDEGAVVAEAIQVVCGACGTMHRLARHKGVCRVSALHGPVRSAHPVSLRDGTGEAFQVQEWDGDDAWHPVGQQPGGLDAADRLACSHCHRAGHMLTLDGFLYPGGYVPGKPRREACPVCHGPVECVGVSDSI